MPGAPSSAPEFDRRKRQLGEDPFRVFRYATASPFHLTRYETKQHKPVPSGPAKGINKTNKKLATKRRLLHLQGSVSSWRERLVPETLAAHALDPHDLAAVKLLVSRPKDLALLRELYSTARLKPEIVRERIDLLPIPVELMPRLPDSYRSMFLAR